VNPPVEDCQPFGEGQEEMLAEADQKGIKKMRGEPRKSRGTGEGLGLALFLFIFILALSAQAADTGECLKCHKNPKLSRGKKDGSLLSLYVNEDAFAQSVHGAAGLGCTECHPEAKPDIHPAEGFPEPDCTTCHPDAAEAYKKTTHGMVLASGVEKGPKCWDCHTAHYIRKISDPLSPVNTSHLANVCGRCHEEARPPGGLLVALATFRIQGHPKVILDHRYDTQGCANCHPENAGHSPKADGGPVCVKCHDRSVATPVLLGPIHVKMSFREQPIPYILRILYGAGFVVVVIGCIGFFSYRFYLHKKKKKESPPKSEGEKGSENP
jgi:hypothetical protein